MITYESIKHRIPERLLSIATIPKTSTLHKMLCPCSQGSSSECYFHSRQLRMTPMLKREAPKASRSMLP